MIYGIGMNTMMRRQEGGGNDLLPGGMESRPTRYRIR
jgi:hypothetical protein